MDLNKLTTEKRNERSMNLDTLSTEQVIRLMNEEDAVVPKAIEQIVPTIAKAVDAIIARFKKNGRLIYIGAGTSGRLGVLDAVECVPTFGVPPEKVVGVIAGGDRAMYRAVEGAEDSPTLGQQDLTALSLTKEDVVVGIAASGRTPYVIGALTYANEVGAETIALSCNQDAEISAFANIAIEVIVGAEVLTGSTRLKAGTAQKLVLNMLSTASMIGIGKVYNNLMVDVQPTNEKLRVRAVRIIQQATECTEEQAQEAFEQSGEQVKIAIVMILFDQTKEQAEETLVQNQGFIRKTT
ncbi:N-acetylmuramic acid 6-phosphate etherase [Kurthia sp. Dielmo]|uniref:N-acetylmuramic acid 6-phosphate etherase n=1 Tax=Kurthia sp. Dielmo TaxID=1033738 RepID=UPI0003122235|nr:N-acetylmuramic acid 6-phosphate etherase [Kurthia sp. Dielmo]